MAGEEVVPVEAVVVVDGGQGGGALTKGVWVPLADNFGSFPVGLASRESSHRFVLLRPALTTADGHNPKSLQLVSREEIVY